MYCVYQAAASAATTTISTYVVAPHAGSYPATVPDRLGYGRLIGCRALAQGAVLVVDGSLQVPGLLADDDGGTELLQATEV
jgi:hypothetical protein